MDITRRWQNLLVATVVARLPDSAEQHAMLQIYNEAVAVLRDWEHGVPLEERGVNILEDCRDKLHKAKHLVRASQAASF